MKFVMVVSFCLAQDIAMVVWGMYISACGNIVIPDRNHPRVGFLNAIMHYHEDVNPIE